MIVYGNHCNCGKVSRASQPIPEPKAKAVMETHAPVHRGKRIVCVETQMVYESIAHASREMGIGRDSIAAALNARKPNRTAGGYRFEYLPRDER